MTDWIPHNKLEDGFERAKIQVDSFIESSKLALSKKHYSISIGLSILAFTEMEVV